MKFENADRDRESLNKKMGYPYNIALVGFMGAGKSTVSHQLRQMLNLQEYETDEMIVQKEGMAITEIFEKRGEPYFRDCESRVVASLGECSQSVISCGGGLVMRAENVANLKKSSRIVLLRAQPATILGRVINSTGRPILNGHMNEEYISSLMEKRRGAYESAADIVVDTDKKSIRKICDELLEKLAAYKN